MLDETVHLMAGIIGDPDTDPPRLVYADWLEEHGEPARAEFIRLQCTLAAQTKNTPQKKKLIAGEQSLIKEFGPKWIGPLDKLGAEPRFERGLLRNWYALTGKFMQKAYQQTLLAHLPILGTNWMILRGSTKRVDVLSDCESLAWTPSLTWYDTQLDDEGIKRFSASPHLHRLSGLMLEKLRCTDAGLADLANSDRLPLLRRLRLIEPVYGGRFTAKGVLAVLKSKKVPLLEELAVTTAFRFKLGSFAAGPPNALSRLKRLFLRTGESFSPIAACSRLTGLRDLQVESHSHAFTDDNLSTLVENRSFEKLQRFAFQQPRHCSAISKAVLKRLKDRFGAGLSLTPNLEYS
jgi:uncharacterized protein (TIGR02996 family)